eukprot:TRINITY_DN30520_c0_g1_i1.p1 TRINITY_DN30520_c0_g1~~TRINITY_DN30520_c0_g1_i1.p1  ORF type:complete len:555 (-),score=67.35 TRINITY_DN30520_c0_g1_i1:136-1626(-)
MTEFKRTTQAVDEVEELTRAAVEGQLHQLERLAQLVRDTGPVVEKLMRKATERDPTKQTYGPGMCAKICALDERWTSISSLASDVLGQQGLTQANPPVSEARSTLIVAPVVQSRPGPGTSGRSTTISDMDAAARPHAVIGSAGSSATVGGSAHSSGPSRQDLREMAARAAETRMNVSAGTKHSASACQAAASSETSASAEGVEVARAQCALVTRMDTLMNLVHFVFWGHGYRSEAQGQGTGAGVDGATSDSTELQTVRRVIYTHQRRQSIVTTYVPVFHHLMVYAAIEGDCSPSCRVALQLGLPTSSVHAKTDYLLVYPLVYHHVVPTLPCVPPEALFTMFCSLAIPALAALGCTSRALTASVFDDDVLWWHVLQSLPPTSQLSAAVEATIGAQRQCEALSAGECRRLVKAEVERARHEANMRRRALEERQRQDRIDPLCVGPPQRPMRPFPQGPFGGGGVFGGDRDLMPGGGFFGGMDGRRPFGGGGGGFGGGFM